MYAAIHQATDASPGTVLLRRPALLARLGRSNTALHGDIHAGLMTPPVAIGPRAVAWPSHEADAIVAARVAGLADDEIKALVRRLIAARAVFAL